MCVLVSGYLERAVIALVLEYSARSSSPSVQKFVELRISKTTTNLNLQRLKELFGSFDSDWEKDLSQFVVEERKEAIDSIVSLRNAIAHGQSVDVTYNRICAYYEQIQKVVDHVAELCVPDDAKTSTVSSRL